MALRTIVQRTGGNLSYADEFYPVSNSIWKDCPLLAYLQDPNLGHLYYNDFHTFAPADWTITTTEAGAGDATEAITDEAGGVLLITNAAAATDSDELQHVGEAWQLAVGKPLWFESRWKISDGTQSNAIMGLIVTDTTLVDGAQDGVWFEKNDGDANIDYHCDKDNSDTTGDTGIDIVTNTFVRTGIKFDGAGTVSYYINGVQVAASAANVPDDELLRISFALQNGEAVAKTKSLDYIKCFQIR